MERARATWTDERLDDLARRMDQGFVRVDTSLRSMDARIDRQGAGLGARIDAQGAELGVRIDAQGAELGARIAAQGEGLNARIDSLQRTMLQVGGGIIASILVATIGLIAAGY